MLTQSILPLQLSATVGALLAAYYLVPYLLDPHGYRRRFSGPWLAGFTNWWLSNKINEGSHSKVVIELHQKYGTFVRIGPNHISISDPNAYEAVYGHGSGLLKPDFYHTFQNGKTNMFDTRDRVEHAAKRKRIANIFSPQNVLAFEPRVRALIQQAVAQLDMRCKASERGISGFNWTAKGHKVILDCCSQFSYLAFDIIGDLAVGSPFGLIQAQKDTPTIRSVDASGKPAINVTSLSVARNIARTGRMVTSLGVYPRWTHHIWRFLPWNIPVLLGQIRFVKLSIDSVEARIKRGPREMKGGEKGIDLIDKLLDVRNEDGAPLSKWEVYAEAIMLLIAGSDTTSNSLSGLCYYLATHPQAQRRLQAELDLHMPISLLQDDDELGDPAPPPLDVVAKYEQIKNLPYLNACLKEALRLYSTVGTGLPRVVPPGKSFTFGGETFNTGSIISVPSFTTNRSDVWGPDAEEFRPERWLEGPGGLSNYFVAFSTGPRGCVGRNLATMDMLLIAATIFRRYEFEAVPSTKLNTREAFVREAYQCEVALKLRKVT